jgi:glycosyltransferase AglI
MKPLISVIIPVYNDPTGLRDTCISLINQKFDKTFYEIIIVDNNSKDNTLKIANDFKNKYPNLIKILTEDEMQSSYAARNRGIVSSKGDIIALIDSDMIINSDWLSKIKNTMSDESIKYMGCNVKIFINKRTCVALYNKVTGFKVEGRIKFKHYSPTCCLVIKKELTNEIGMFDSRLISSGDLEFGIRAWRAGFKQVFAEDILMKHPARYTLKQILKKYFRIGRGKYQLFSYYPDLYNYKNIIMQYIFVNPIYFIKKMRGRKKIYKFHWLYVIIFYFIKWLHSLAILIGYYYEKL